MADREATRDAFAGALVGLGEQDPRICVLDADLSGSTKTSLFASKFPDRFFNIGIAEQNMIGIAAGLASCGKVPFAGTFAVFATGRVYDQIRLTVAYPRSNVKIAATHSGVTVGEDGASHQALEDIALMRVLPGMTVLVPADGPAARRCAELAVEFDGPVYIRLGRPAVPVVYRSGCQATIGKAQVVREGTDVAVIACGIMVANALAAAELLAGEGISTQVVDMMTVKPMDEDAVAHAAACGALVVAEEHSIIGGLGSAVAQFAAGNMPVPMAQVGVKDMFGISGPGADLVDYFGLGVENIADACRKVLARK